MTQDRTRTALVADLERPRANPVVLGLGVLATLVLSANVAATLLTLLAQ